MDKEILEQLQQLFKDFFKDETIVLSLKTTANDIIAWDSFNHIQLITLVEQHFKIRFSVFELADLSNVGDLVHGIQKKIV